MRKLVIILALVALTFIGLLVYGMRGDRQTGSGDEQIQLPKRGKDGGEPDVSDDWKPPKTLDRLAKKTRGLTARFAPDLKLDKPVTLNSIAGTEVSFAVKESHEEKARAAHIELKQGEWAALELRNRFGGKLDGAEPLCLCHPTAPLEPALLASCSADWTEEHMSGAKPGQRAICGPDDWRGILPVGEQGGLITLRAGPPAKVSIR